MAIKRDNVDDEPILTTEEVARMLAVSKMTVRRWIESGVILRDEWFRPGKDYRIYARAVRRLRGGEPGRLSGWGTTTPTVTLFMTPGDRFT